LITGTPNGNAYINPSEFQLSRGEGFIYVLPLGVPVIKKGGVYICIAVGSSSYQEERGLYMYYRWEFQLSRGEGFNTYINPSPLYNWNSQR
jgi:hypothetical protein